MQRDRADRMYSRRAVLKQGAVLGGGLIIGIALLDERATAAESGARGSAVPVPFNAFVRIAPDDHIVLIMPAVEMGQGVYTSNAMILAEELDVALDQVILEHAPPDQKNYGSPVAIIQVTGGSTTTSAWFTPLRKAGAAARALLLQAAAADWHVEASTLRTARGRVYHDASGRSVSYGKLATRAASLPVPAEPMLKDPKSFTLIGKPVRRLDGTDKSTGKMKFGIDVMLPGMKFATLTCSPVFGGKVARVDDRQARAVPGVSQIVVLDDLVAVVGTHMWAAKQGLAALSVEWTDGPHAGLTQEVLWSGLQHASREPGVVAEKIGDAAEQLASGAIFEANYELPLLAHTAMEPMNATVHVHDGVCEIWVGTQVPGKVQAGAAEILRIDPARVVVNNQYIGGGFGRRLEPDGPLKAVRIAQQVRGPVKVVWTREEDIRQSYYRPMYHDRLRARVANGRIVAWHHRVTGPAIMARWLPPAFRDGVDPDATNGAIEQPYDFPARLVEYVRHETPVPAGFWRGVGPNSNAFSAECFLDWIARQTRIDPVAFRRSMLTKSPRLRRVLDAVASKAGWGMPPTAVAGKRVGRGVALLQCFGSFLACVADVAIADDGDVDVTRVCVAVDVGTVINPTTVEAQVQGGVVFGIGTVLHNEITIAKGRVQQSNFHDYRILRIPEMPTIEVHVLSSTEPPGGIGEPGTVVVQPAIVNAIFAATGTQLTRMPIDRARIARHAV